MGHIVGQTAAVHHLQVGSVARTRQRGTLVSLLPRIAIIFEQLTNISKGRKMVSIRGGGGGGGGGGLLTKLSNLLIAAF